MHSKLFIFVINLIFAYLKINIILMIKNKSIIRKKKGIPGNEENPNTQSVELNRSSLFWGLLLFFVLAVLFSSYFLN